jgi:hypothetical protein
MKLEEALPAYREGKVIVSCSRYRYTKYDPCNRISRATDHELLGEWIVVEEPKPKRVVKMSPAVCVCPRGEFYVTLGLFASEEAARKSWPELSMWPAKDGNGEPMIYAVEVDDE